MILHFKRAIQDILSNRFLNAVTVITIALSILIVSAFWLFFINAGDAMNEWKKGIRVMAYLKPDITKDRLEALSRALSEKEGVQAVRFISKTEAFEVLKKLMNRQTSLLDDLDENPLPDAFEIRVLETRLSRTHLENLAKGIESLDDVESVEYGEKWLGRFSNIMQIFKFVGYALAGLFLMAAIFIVANTIRLVLYTRREEAEIMQLVGATNAFIKTPFYIEGLIQGALGGGLGLGSLFVMFVLASSNVGQGFSVGLIQIRFLSPVLLGVIMLCSMLIGWLGSYLSLRQFLKL